MTRQVVQPSAGIIDDIEREDASKGYEPEDARVLPRIVSVPTVADETEIGPRYPGAIYQNVTGRYEVLALITDPAEAARLLRRDSARWAVIVRDTLRPDGQPHAVGMVWTNEDYLLRPGRPPYAAAA
ncbi:hypothetical protein [Streptomyces sp. ISL-12]|uniref:hypothetical protein n=1 Tax=Streptomyces sp. ISL-12 TaxID=2819177 RepID=UPI002036310A|nr:hypothetical protein [Streptomyces sp. ISL-12]